MWKKSSVACIDSITTHTGKNYTLGNATSDTTVYYSTSYTLDETTATYTLVNPKSATLQYAQWGIYSVEMVKSNYYIWGSTSSNEIYTTNASSTYNVHLKNADGEVFLESDSANYKYDIYSAKIEYTFLDYVVSDKETVYPDGGEKGGYWYERVSEGITPEMFGYTKMAVDTFTLTSRTKITNYTISHSLGEIPKFIFIVAESLPTVNGDIYNYVNTNDTQNSYAPSGKLTYYDSGFNNQTYNNSHAKSINANSFYVEGSAYYCYRANVKHTVITMA